MISFLRCAHGAQARALTVAALALLASVACTEPESPVTPQLRPVPSGRVANLMLGPITADSLVPPLGAFGSLANGPGGPYVVGEAYGPIPGFGGGRTLPVRWSRTPGAPGVVLTIPAGAGDARLFAGNASGAAVGNAMWPYGASTPCGFQVCLMLWSNGQVTPLPLPAGVGGFGARAISSSGIVGGWVIYPCGTPPCELMPVLWVNGVFQTLPSVYSGPGTWNFVTGVNASGTAVGYARPATGPAVPVEWSGGQAQPLPLPAGTTQGSAAAINDAGVIVGAVGTGTGNSATAYAVQWVNGVPDSLPAVPGYPTCGAEGLNSLGHIVGTCHTSTGQYVPVIWRDSLAFPLAPFAGPLTGTVGIADDDVVVLGQWPNLSPNTLHYFFARPTFFRPPGETPPGSNVVVAPIDPATGTSPVTLTFASVTTLGMTTVTTSSSGAPPPLGFAMGTPTVYYDVQTTATYSGAITVCFSYTPSAYSNPANLSLFHGDGVGGWTDVTTSNDVNAGILCGSVTSLSPFILAELHYNFTGFFPPVANPGPTNSVVNTLKAGAAVPVKFSLGGNLGLNVLAANSPTSSAYPCGGGAEGTVAETVTAGGSSFTYDATAGQYVYVWKTDKTWAGSCRKLSVTLQDGTTQTALFKFLK